MQVATALIVALLFSVAPALGQSAPQHDSHRVAKVLIGAGALALGTVVASQSSETTTVTNALGKSETSTFSTSQLATGLVIAGTGGFLLWDGLREHHQTSPSTAVGIAVAKQSGRVFIRRIW